VKLFRVLPVLSAALAAQTAHAQRSDIHDAMFAALRSQQGAYTSELKGDFAALVQQKLNTSAPVFVAVSTVRAFKQQGCKRLRADVTVPDLTWEDPKTGAQNSFSYRYEMNLCPDGSPPLEAALETQKPSAQGAIPLSPQVKGKQ
jgi:hypothetical protein